MAIRWLLRRLIILSEAEMEKIIDRLKALPKKLSDRAFLRNEGLSNEVGIHIFCYEPSEQPIVDYFFNDLKNDNTQPFRLIECNLYKILLEICEDKRILNQIPRMEEQRGKDFLINQLQKIATPEVFVEKMQYGEMREGDILLITGVGEVYPYMRSHKILDNLQHVFEKIPVLMLYPGVFSGQRLDLFGKFVDGNYYRAFNLI